jgi:hypothetical protein
VHGATDEQVARKLGVSLRTVRRIAAELSEQVGASGRFELGVRAAQREWVDYPQSQAREMVFSGLDNGSPWWGGRARGMSAPPGLSVRSQTDRTCRRQRITRAGGGRWPVAASPSLHGNRTNTSSTHHIHA